MQIVDVIRDTGQIAIVYGIPSTAHGSPGSLEPEHARYMVPEGQYVSANTHYRGPGEFLERQEIPLQVTKSQIVADGQDEATITDIPTGVQVSCDGQIHAVLDGQVEFSTDMPGTYRLKFSGVEYLDKEVIVEAVSD